MIEIRNDVLLSESLTDKVRQFRDGRLAKIAADETPVPFTKYPKTVMQIYPISGLDPTRQVNPKSIDSRSLPPLGALSGWNFRFNFDGPLTFRRITDTECDCYLQLFRNGAIESVSSWILKASPDNKMFSMGPVEDILIKGLEYYIKMEKILEFEPPFFVMISLLGVKGYKISHIEIDRDSLILPDILLEDYESEPERILRPTFDAIWQAAGIGRSMSYDEEGNRI
jgi:hypothetical protein